MNVCKNEISDAVEAELVAANEKYPPFASLHEAYAVVKEEFEEAKVEIDEYKKLMDDFWNCIKDDDIRGALELTAKMKHTGIRLAMEASQMAAMAIKAEQSIVNKMD
ncbi:MAG: hypothetical protein K2H01_06050 [Ruminococcus sp.]|nr:hypothetical protein [Ruminococcus sp.]